ncbi:DUF6221 family protein [Streptomyces sp. NPDC085612]|uniref:DUF6221 family protein n=1 Tax=Streptomyces sp. NPDC085612 TaxID=3365732 RepID=UPI0037D4D603
MDDLVQFLRDRYGEESERATAATPGPWTVDSESYAESISSTDGVTVVGGGRWGGEASVFESTEDALHIAAHHPARVLAEVDAKRRILGTVVPRMNEMDDQINSEWGNSYTPVEYESEGLLRLLALPYADHPDYRAEWRPTA